jgi:hypothetical protein
MPCERIQMPGGGWAIIRRSRRPKCYYCANEHDVLCDAPAGDGKTCDRKCCRAHAKKAGPNQDLCRDHALAEVKLARQRVLFPADVAKFPGRDE